MKFYSAAVTGGTGFLGKYLLKNLVEQGMSVRVLCEKDEDVPGCDVVAGDLRDINCLKKLVAGADVVFHLAGQADVEKAERDRTANFDVNVRGTLNLLESAQKEGASKIVFASTSHVYGRTEGGPVTEKEECKPANIYGLNKLLAERLCLFYAQSYGLDCAIARMSNLYGTGMNVGVVKELISRAKSGGCLELKSMGKEQRDFLHGEDAAGALMLLAEKGVGVFNVGSGHGTSIRKLAKLILKETGCRKKLAVGKSESWDMVLSIAKIRKLGYVPHRRIEADIKDIIAKG